MLTAQLRMVVPPSATLFAFPPPPSSPSANDSFFRTLGIESAGRDLSKDFRPAQTMQLGRGQVVKAFQPQNAAALKQAPQLPALSDSFLPSDPR
eukprot:tig00021038_g17542.t1